MDQELEDSLPVESLAMDDSDEVTLNFVMAERSSTYMRNSGNVKYLLHGTRKNFQMLPIEKDEGLSVKTNVFGIVKSTDEIDGKKKYTAKMYKTNANFMSRECKSIAIR